jgi:hypothetical protein
MIFQRYAELGSVALLKAELDDWRQQNAGRAARV